MTTPIYTKPDYSNGIWAFEGAIVAPNEDKVASGHVVERPPFEVSNYIENRQDQGIAYLFQQGIATWDNVLSYPVGALVKRSGMIYRALVENTDADPTLNTSIWERAFQTFNEGVTLANRVTEIETVDEHLQLYVAKSNPQLVGRAYANGIIAATGIPDTGLENTGYTFLGHLKDGIYHNGDCVVAVKDGVEVVAFKQSTGLPEYSNTVATVGMLSSAIASHEIYVVGDIYITTTPISPAVRFGYGTWERFAKGLTLVGFSDSGLTPNWTRSIGSVYGEYTHTLTISEIPEHKHRYTSDDQANGQGGQTGRRMGTDFSQSGSSGAAFEYFTATDHPSESGMGLDHNNVQPSIVVYMWRRTA